MKIDLKPIGTKPEPVQDSGCEAALDGYLGPGFSMDQVWAFREAWKHCANYYSDTFRDNKRMTEAWNGVEMADLLDGNEIWQLGKTGKWMNGKSPSVFDSAIEAIEALHPAEEERKND